MKILICEDESISAQFLKDILLGINKKYEILIAASLLECIKLINNFKPELLFLDIDLGKNNSFELFDVFDSNTLNIVFVSSHQEFAIQAFKIEAIDYILKPISKSAVETACERYFKKTKNLNINKINTILVWDKDKYNAVNIETIIKIKSSNQYTILHFNDGKKLMQSSSLNDFENKLMGNNFIRIHDSCMVNLNYVKNYMPGINSRIQLKNDEFEAISRRKKSEFLNVYKKQ